MANQGLGLLLLGAAAGAATSKGLDVHVSKLLFPKWAGLHCWACPCPLRPGQPQDPGFLWQSKTQLVSCCSLPLRVYPGGQMHRDIYSDAISCSYVS